MVFCDLRFERLILAVTNGKESREKVEKKKQKRKEEAIGGGLGRETMIVQTMGIKIMHKENRLGGLLVSFLQTVSSVLETSLCVHEM